MFKLRLNSRNNDSNELKLRIYSQSNPGKIDMQTHTAQVLETLHGKDGKDYVLTEADRVEIAQLAAEMVEIPEIPDIPEGVATEDWVKGYAEAKGSASEQVGKHDISGTSHSDIRKSVSDLSALIGEETVSAQIDKHILDYGTVAVNLEGAVAGEANPVNADTLGGIPAGDYATKEYVDNKPSSGGGITEAEKQEIIAYVLNALPVYDGEVVQV